jgi:hypothetical protein
MEFKLPAHLQDAVASYDPVLKEQKKLQEATKPKATNKANRFTLGKVDFLIPEHYVSKKKQLEVCEQINTSAARHRFHVFTFNDKHPLAIAAIYYYESVWYATWVPKTNDQCIYGYSYAYKDNATTRDKIDYSYKNEIESTEQVLVGRTVFLYKSFEITKEYIRDQAWSSTVSAPTERFKPYGFVSYYEKATYMRNAVVEVRRAITNKISTWQRNSRSVFDLIYRDTVQEYALVNDASRSVKDIRDLYLQYPFNTDGFIQFIKDYLKKYANAYDGSNYVYGTNFSNIFNVIAYSTTDFISIIERPFFRRLIADVHIEATKAFDERVDPSKVTDPFKKLARLLRNMNDIFKIWPDCPLDYIQNHHHILCNATLYDKTNVDTHTWLRDNMSYKTFFNMLNKSYELANEHERERASYTYLLTDSFCMLNSLLRDNIEVQRPNRWRLAEFHDQLSTLIWKQNNENIKLPQDLFPEPVHVSSATDQRWTFIQPIDTHQLGSWGQAVRNCVGSASSYANGIKKKEHFIVLGMVDNKPTFTVQLKVNAGVMSVVQLVGIANARLTDEQRNEYEQMFRKALETQEARLESA